MAINLYWRRTRRAYFYERSKIDDNGLGTKSFIHCAMAKQALLDSTTRKMNDFRYSIGLRSNEPPSMVAYRD